jgi:hypothetical protein
MLDLWDYLNLNPWHLDHKDISQGQQTWAHFEHNKCGLSAIKLISPSQIINKTTGDKCLQYHQHHHNLTIPITLNLIQGKCIN